MKINIIFSIIFSIIGVIHVLALTLIEKILIPQYGSDFRISSDIKTNSWALIGATSFFIYGFLIPKNQTLTVSFATLISASICSSFFSFITYDTYGKLFIKYFNQENIFEMIMGSIFFYLLPSIVIGSISFLFAKFISKFFIFMASSGL